MVQDNELSPPKERTKQAYLLLAIKLVVTILILSYIYKTFSNEQKGIGDIGEVFGSILNTEHIATIFLILALVPVNWAFESLKWQKLAGKVIRLSFWDAFRGTLTGLAVGVAAPAQLGDTIGRIAALKSDRRLEAIGAALVSNGIQFYVSVVAGAFGWLHIQNRLSLTQTSKHVLSLLLAAIIILGITTVWLRKPIMQWRPRKPFFIQIQSYIKIIGSYSPGEIGVATLLGTFRYLIFLSQFVLALSLFDLPVPITDLISCVSLIFLAKTLIPAINVLGDLGLREFTALLVFASYNLPPERIIAATFMVWIVNVLGPILIGIFLIWKYKWKAIRVQEKLAR